jgi:nucleotide-binding universal stress UspA family protein
MFQWKKILCPVDFSEVSRGALRLACDLTKACGGKLVLLYVVEPIIAPADFTLGPVNAGELEDQLVERSRKALSELVGTLDLPGDAVEVKVERGRASLEVCRVAEETKADAIVIGTHGYTGMAHVLLGSTAERVIRKAPCPVVTVRAQEAEEEK